MKKALDILTRTIVLACDKNPICCALLILFYYSAFNHFLSLVEIIIFGDRFEHWLDPVFTMLFISWSGLTTYYCAAYKEKI